jgi:hypothetical protein
MRRLAVVGSLAMLWALIAPASAASGSSWKATLAGAGISGTVTVAITSPTSATLAEDIKGLTPRSLSVLWLRGGSCSSTSFGIARVRWTVPASGHLVVTVNLSPAMIGFFRSDMSHRGGVHATMTDGSATACSPLKLGG